MRRDQPLALALVGQQLQLDPPAADDLQPLADAAAIGALQKHQPLPLRWIPAGHLLAQKKALDPPARAAPAEEPRGNHSRVVDHQQVPRGKQRWQVGKNAKLGPACPAAQHHQPGLIASRQRMLGDKGPVERIVEIACNRFHQAVPPAASKGQDICILGHTNI